MMIILAQYSFGQVDSLKIENDLNKINTKIETFDSSISEVKAENNRISLLQSKNNDLIRASQINNDKYDSLFKAVNARNLSLSKQLIRLEKNNNKSIDNIKRELINKIDADGELFKSSSSKLENKIISIQKDSDNGDKQMKHEVSQKVVYAVFGLIILLVIIIIIYVFLVKKMKSSDKNIFNEFASSRKIMEEEAVRLDNKLANFLEKQLILLQNQEESKSNNSNVISTSKTIEQDHSLALKVADEIIRIEKNLLGMEDGIKGKKQLNASVGRIRSNFQANGYEIVDMLNKPYSEGMKVEANFRTDEGLGSDEQIITRIIKPQVNYKGIMIKAAQIEVSQGE